MKLEGKGELCKHIIRIFDARRTITAFPFMVCVVVVVVVVVEVEVVGVDPLGTHIVRIPSDTLVHCKVEIHRIYLVVKHRHGVELFELSLS